MEKVHLTARVNVDLKDWMQARFGNLRRGISGFIEEACERERKRIQKAEKRKGVQ